MSDFCLPSHSAIDRRPRQTSSKKQSCSVERRSWIPGIPGPNIGPLDSAGFCWILLGFHSDDIQQVLNSMDDVDRKIKEEDVVSGLLGRLQVGAERPLYLASLEDVKKCAKQEQSSGRKFKALL